MYMYVFVQFMYIIYTFRHARVHVNNLKHLTCFYSEGERNLLQEEDYMKRKRNVIGKSMHKHAITDSDVVTPPSPKRNIVNQLDVVGKRKRKLVTSSANGSGHW